MCFQFDKEYKRLPKTKIATEDIKCYKAVTLALSNNILEELTYEILLSIKNHNLIKNVKVYNLYSFINVNKYEYVKGKINKTNFSKETNMDDSYIIGINQGFHSYKEEVYKSVYKDEKVVKETFRFFAEFLIPKGSRYYENKYNYVSNQIVFKGIIDKKVCKLLPKLSNKY